MVIISLLSIFTPLTTNALTINSDNKEININIEDYIYVADDLDNWTEDYNQEQTCDPNNSILGNPEDEDSVAWLLQQILNYIKVLGPILVVILSSVEFVKVIVQGDDDAMAKAQKKLFYRLMLAAMLFFIPVLVEFILDIFGLTSDPTCGLK